MLLSKNDCDLRNSTTTPVVKAFLQKKNLEDLYHSTVSKYSLLNQLKNNLNLKEITDIDHLIKKPKIGDDNTINKSKTTHDRKITFNTINEDSTSMIKSSSKIQSRKSSYIQFTEPNSHQESEISPKELSIDSEKSVNKKSPDHILANVQQEIENSIPEYLRCSKKLHIHDLKDKYLTPTKFRKSVRMILNNQEQTVLEIKNYLTKSKRLIL